MRTCMLFFSQLPAIVLTLLGVTIFQDSCSSKELPMITDKEIYKKGHLTAKPGNIPEAGKVKTGLQSMSLRKSRDGLIYVPKGYNRNKPSALAVVLHGAGGNAEHGLNLLRQYADERNIIIVAPASGAATWDIIAKDSFDEDVLLIDRALSKVFTTYNIDTNHIALGGFSDGASYALSLGLSNGQLFTHVIAFSPGFFSTVETKGAPEVFISHGIRDKVLPIDPCSRRIVPQLKRQGYKLNYKEFDGEHQIPAPISQAAINWFFADRFGKVIKKYSRS